VIREFDVVELIHPFEGISVGSKGTILMRFDDAYEIEFEGYEDTRSVPAGAVRIVWKAPDA